MPENIDCPMEISVIQFQAWPIWWKPRFLRLLSKRSKHTCDKFFTYLVVTCLDHHFLQSDLVVWISKCLNYVRFLSKFVTEKIGPLSHLNGFHLFPRDSIRKTLCITHSLNIQIHCHLLYWLASFCIKMTNNSGVMSSLVQYIYLNAKETQPF